MTPPPRHDPNRRARIRAAFAALRRERGDACRACGHRRDLQWAHRCPTELNGLGRGSYERLRDIYAYPRRYILLCVSCHRAYDAGWLRQASWAGGWRCDLIRRGISTGHDEIFIYYPRAYLRRGRTREDEGRGMRSGISTVGIPTGTRSKRSERVGRERDESRDADDGSEGTRTPPAVGASPSSQIRRTLTFSSDEL